MKKPRRILLVIALLAAVIQATSMHISVSSEEAEFPSDFPYLFVYPQSIIANVGENVTVSICIFNLTSNIFRTNDIWQSPNDPYPTYDPDGVHAYPLGSLLGFDINFTWDPKILEYISHTVTVPFEDYRDPIPPMNYSGTLYMPVQSVKEEVDKDKGRMWIAMAHQGTKVFNGNGTILQITFQIKREGGSELKIANAKLATIKLLVPGANKDIIIFRVGNGFVTTPGARTRLYSLDIKAAVGIIRFNPPIIKGENVSVKVTVKNDGNTVDSYNLTVYHKSPDGVEHVILFRENEIIEPRQSQTEEIIILADDISVGVHEFNVSITVLHEEELFKESRSQEVRVISGEVAIQISWTPKPVYAGTDITFTATVNIIEPGVTVQNVTWQFYEHGEKGGLALRNTLYGPTVTYNFPFPKNWTVVVVITDSLGTTWNQYRPAAANYRNEVTIQVLEAIEEAGFPWDLVILAIIIITIIVLVAIYIRHKRR